MKKRLAVLVFVAAALVGSIPTHVEAWCQENPEVVCGTRCKIVMGVGACFWEQNPWYDCVYTSNGCVAAYDECCWSFEGGF